MGAQGCQQLQQRIAGGLCRVFAPGTDQVGELLVRQAQFVVLDTKEIADALEVVPARQALAGQVAVELCAIDRQAPTDLGNRAVVAAQ